MKPKVSIIVPIYNVEKYLSRCFESLIGQSLKEIEIIAVNDGSTDQSLKVLNHYALRDKRIKVIDCANGGVSSARNKGIEAAKGNYIAFVDPDDWVEKQMYESMYNHAIAEKAEIVMCSYIREFESHSKPKIFNLPVQVKYENKEVKVNIMRRLIGPVNDEIGNPEMVDAWGTIWSKIYKTELIRQNRIQFIDLNKIGTNEDSLFNMEASYFARSFLFLNKPFYHYWRANSTSITSRYNPNLMDQWFYLFSYIEKFLQEKGLNEEYYKALNNRICLNTLGFGLNTISKDNRSPFWMKIKKINIFLRQSRIKHSYKQLELFRFPFVWKVFYFCAKFRFATSLYFMLVCIEYLRKTIR